VDGAVLSPADSMESHADVSEELDEIWIFVTSLVSAIVNTAVM
jgi:hypothetical protein